MGRLPSVRLKPIQISGAVLCGVLLTGACLGTVPLHAQEQSRTVPQPIALKPRQTIVLFGDSITATGDYGQIIQDALDAKYPGWHLKVLSRGSHGDTAERSQSRVQSDIVTEKPDWVTINFGINDVGCRSPEEFEADMTALLDRLRKGTKARFVIVSPVYPDRDTEDTRLVAYLPVYQRLAKKYGALYAPLFETMSRLRTQIPAGVKYAPDGVHPNDIGHEIIAQTILQTWNFAPPAALRNIEVPAIQASAPRSIERVGTKFTLPLPRPATYTLTELQLPNAVALPAAKPVVLDGKLDEWQRKSTQRLEKPEQRIWGVTRRGVPYVTANLNAAYGFDALYLAIDVQDSAVFAPANPPRPIDRDWVEICLDLRPAAERAEKPVVNLTPTSKRVGQLIISAPGVTPSAVFAGMGDPALKDEIQVAGQRTKSGYALEVRIPVSSFPEGRLPTTPVGFDWGVVDIAPGGYYLSATGFRWTGSGSSSFSTREFGTLRFAASE